MIWLEAFGWGWVASAGLLLGAAAGMYGPLEHRGIARTMAFGAGILLAALSADMLISAWQALGGAPAAAAMLAGAGVFSGVNAWLSRRGAKDRKRCGGCVRQATESDHPGSGAAIAAGTIMDAIPEGLILGLETAQTGSPGLATLAAFVLGNFPEALSASSGMTVARRPKHQIWLIWLAAAAITATTAGLSAAFLPGASEANVAYLNAAAAGALLAMTVETLVPEAADGSPAFNGIFAAAGFILLLALLP